MVTLSLSLILSGGTFWAEFDCQKIAVGLAHGELPVGRVDRRDRDILGNDPAHGRDLGLGLRCVDQNERKGKAQDTSYCHDKNLHELTSRHALF